MMRNFKTSGSLTLDKELKEDPGRRDVTSFPREDVVMMVYDGHPLPWSHRMSNISSRTSTHYG
jgi:hypothetical protein